MSLKPLVKALMITAGVAVSASSVSAQDWWTPGRWSSARPSSGYSTRYGDYGSSYSGRVCRPSYGSGYYRSGNYGSHAHRSPNYRHYPDYNTGIVPWNMGSNYRGPQYDRHGYNPFYE